MTPVSKGQYWKIKNSLTVTQKEIIKFYELQWTLRHRVPTVEEVVQYINSKYEKEGKDHRLKQTALNYYLQNRVFTKALDDRGIPWKQHSREELTDQQMAAAMTVMNMMDERPIADKLDAIGVSTTQYYAWLNDPMFKNYVDTMAENNKINVRPAAITEFTKKINKGDWPAIKFWLETTGELTNSEAPQSEVLIKMIIEIIQKHVKDPDTIVAIAQDIKLASANRTLEIAYQPPIQGEFVENDVELQQAKKMIGFG